MFLFDNCCFNYNLILGSTQFIWLYLFLNFLLICRQLSSGNYFISAEQLLNSLHHQRLKLFSKLVYLDETEINCSCKHSDCCTMNLMEEDIIYLDECLINADNESINDQEKAALFYMAGYVQHKIDLQRVVDTTTSVS